MQKRHVDRNAYFFRAGVHNRKICDTIYRAINQSINDDTLNSNFKIFEIGCGEAGNLKPFLDLGCECLGVDLAEGKINLGKEFLLIILIFQD